MASFDGSVDGFPQRDPRRRSGRTDPASASPGYDSSNRRGAASFPTASSIVSRHGGVAGWSAATISSLHSSGANRCTTRPAGCSIPRFERVSKQHGYDRTFAEVVEQTDRVRASDPRDHAGARARRPRDLRQLGATGADGLSIDLGGIGKGLAADLVADELIAAGANSAYVSLGGDIHAAGEPVDEDGWQVPLLHPATGEPSPTTRSFSGALVMSTVAIRRWTRRRRRAPSHHRSPHRPTGRHRSRRRRRRRPQCGTRRGAGQGGDHRRRQSTARRSSALRDVKAWLISADRVHVVQESDSMIAVTEKLAWYVATIQRHRGVGDRHRQHPVGAHPVEPPGSHTRRARRGCSTSIATSARCRWSSSSMHLGGLWADNFVYFGWASCSCRCSHRGSRARWRGESWRSTSSSRSSHLVADAPHQAQVWHAIHLTSIVLWVTATVHTLHRRPGPPQQPAAVVRRSPRRSWCCSSRCSASSPCAVRTSGRCARRLRAKGSDRVSTGLDLALAWGSTPS